MTVSRRGTLSLRFVALGYLALLLALPVGMIFFKTFEDGLQPVIDALTAPETQHAFYLTMIMVLVAVPLNAVFGVVCAIVLERHRFRGRTLLNAFIDLPFAVSPVVIGLALLLVYSPQFGWFGPWLRDHGVQLVFTVPGMILATIFVSLPFVVREVQPVLQEIGTEQEQAASTLGASPWQTFRRITLPAIRWGLGYGIVLATARALGEFGAVSIVASNIAGEGQTLTLRVVSSYDAPSPNFAAAYSISLVLAAIAITVLLVITRLNPERKST